MQAPTSPMTQPLTGEDAYIAIIYCNEPFRFADGHQMRAANCLVCGQPVGGETVTVIGAAALAGVACKCGGVVSDAFIAHAAHFPMPPAELHTAIRSGLECNQIH